MLFHRLFHRLVHVSQARLIIFFGSGVLLFPVLLSQQEEGEMCDDGRILTFMYATHEVRDPMRFVCVLVYVWMNICGMTA